MPTTFVTLFFKDTKKYIFCLPGNPVSAGVCTHLFVLPYLRSVSGKKIIIHSLKAKVNNAYLVFSIIVQLYFIIIYIDITHEFIANTSYQWIGH